MGNTIQIKRGAPAEKKLLPGEFGLFTSEDKKLYIGVGEEEKVDGISIPSVEIRQIPLLDKEDTDLYQILNEQDQLLLNICYNSIVDTVAET